MGKQGDLLSYGKHGNKISTLLVDVWQNHEEAGKSSIESLFFARAQRPSSSNG